MEQDRVVIENQQKLHEHSSILIDNLGSEIKDLIVHSQDAVQAYKENIQNCSSNDRKYYRHEQWC
jgi:hypothetical protein